MSTNYKEMGQKEFSECLREFQPQIANYEWIWKILRARARKNNWIWNNGLPGRVYSIMRRFFNPEKPYFIGKTSSGVRFLGDIRDDYSCTWALNPDHDQLVLKTLLEQTKSLRGAYVDIGCNMGIFAAVVAQNLKPSEGILAFEPILTTAKRAAATFALNKLTNVRLLPIAIGENNEQLSLYVSPGYSAQTSVHHIDKVAREQWSTITVEARNVDTLLKEGIIGKVGFMKIDVEGHELQVLRGAKELVNQQGPNILYEYNPHTAPQAGWTLKDVTEFLNQISLYRYQVWYDHQIAEFPPPDNNKEVINIYCERTPKA